MTPRLRPPPLPRGDEETPPGGRSALPRQPTHGPAGALVRRWRLLACVAAALLVVLVAASFWLRSARSLLPAVAPAARIDAAESRLRAAVAQRPRDPSAHAALGRYLLGEGRPASALWELEEARALTEGEDAGLFRDRAQALRLVGQPLLAIEALTAIFAAHPNDAPARMELAELLLATGRPADSLARLREPGARSLDPADAALLLGRSYHALGRLTEAEAALRRYARLAPSRSARFQPLGRFLLATGRPVEARVALMRDQYVSFRQGDFHYLLGLTYLHARPRPDLGKAGAAFAVALQFDPRHARARAVLAEVFERQGDTASASATYQAAIRTDPRLPEPHDRLAALLQAQGRAAEAWQQIGIARTLEDRLPAAEHAFSQMLAAEPSDLDAAQSLILTCARMKRVDRAAPAVAALQRQPVEPAVAERVAALDLLTGSRAACRRLGEEWRRREPEAAGPRRVLGRLAVDELRVPEGIRQLEEAWARAPDHAETAASLGLAWARVPTRPNLEQACAWLQRAAALAPTNARTSDQLGQILQQLGRMAEAADAHLRALDLDPELGSAAASLARLASPLDRPAHARLFGRIARSLDDDHRDEERLYRRLWDIALAPTRNNLALAEAHLDLARFLARRGELEKADGHLQQALEARPGWPPAASLRCTVAALLAWG